MMSIVYGPKWPFYSCWDKYMQVLYLGRVPRTKKTLPDFREKCRVARHSRVFRGLTGSQWTPEFRGVTLLLTFGLIWSQLQKFCCDLKCGHDRDFGVAT